MGQKKASARQDILVYCTMEIFRRAGVIKGGFGPLGSVNALFVLFHWINKSGG